MPRTSDPKEFEQLLYFLQAYFARNNYAPSFDEIREGAGLSSKCLVRPRLEKLKDRGYLQGEPNKARAISLTEKGRSYPNLPKPRVATYVSKTARINAAAEDRRVQLNVTGRISAGQMIPLPETTFSIYDEYSTIEVSEDALPPRAKRDEFFVLEVSGESMIEAGIFDGDYVICRRAADAQNNEMVVALLTDTNETTLKYLIREGGHIRLQPANSTMQPILIYDTANLVIQGVVVSVVSCRA